MYGMNGMSWGMGIGWIAGLIILVLVIWAITKNVNSGSSNSSVQKSALDILKERYARGEINQEEFEEKKNALSH